MNYFTKTIDLLKKKADPQFLVDTTWIDRGEVFVVDRRVEGGAFVAVIRPGNKRSVRIQWVRIECPEYSLGMRLLAYTFG